MLRSAFVAFALAAASLPSVASAQDASPPRLLDLQVNPQAVDLSSGPVLFTITATLDDPSGVGDSCYLLYRSPSGAITPRFPLVPGPGIDEYSVTLQLPESLETGEWHPFTLHLIDVLGNETYYDEAAIVGAGYALNLTVTRTVAPPTDTTPPTVTSFVASATAVDVTVSSATVGIELRGYDAESGIQQVQIEYVSPSGQQSAPVSLLGPPVGDLLRAQVLFAPYIESGSWTPRLFVRDGAGNATFLDGATLGNAIAVTSNPDVSAPSLSGFLVSPDPIDVSGGSVPVTFHADVSDLESGLARAEAGIRSPTGAAFMVYLPPVSPGSAETTFPADRTIEPGTWTTEFIRVTDRVGNQRIYMAAELQGIGVDTSVAVVNPFFGGSPPPDDHTVTETVPAGGTVSTGSAPTATEPVVTAVTVPGGGTVTISEAFVSQPAPAAYEFVGVQVNISAPPQTVGAPLVLTFQVQGSLLPVPGDASSLDVFRNGFLVSACDDPASSAAIPTPCVATREILPSGAARFVVYTVSASAWNMGVRTIPLFAFRGFFPPVDSLPTVNSVKAGRTIPLKFSLDGAHGLEILASGYPKSESIPCDSGALMDGVEETFLVGDSALQYDAAADRYVYLWKTEKAWTGCRQLVLKLRDGSSHRANFRFD